MTGMEVDDLQKRLRIAVYEFERILTFIDKQAPHNAQFAVDVVRCMVMNASERITSPQMYEPT